MVNLTTMYNNFILKIIIYSKNNIYDFRNYVTMVTSEHMNQLLKNVLKLIKKNIGNENAPWMTRIAGILFLYLLISLK